MNIFEGASYFNPIYGPYIDTTAFQFASPKPREPRAWTYTFVTVQVRYATKEEIEATFGYGSGDIEWCEEEDAYAVTDGYSNIAAWLDPGDDDAMFQLPNAKFRVVSREYQGGDDPHLIGIRTDDVYLDYKESQEACKRASERWLKRRENMKERSP